jgi:hypothetical protein
MTIRDKITTADDPCPPLTEALVKWLERRFPDRCPVKGTSMEDVWLASGSALVVRLMRDRYKKQEGI